MAVTTTRREAELITQHVLFAPNGSVDWRWGDSKRVQTIFGSSKQSPRTINPVSMQYGFPFRKMGSWLNASMVYQETYGDFRIRDRDGYKRAYIGAYPWESLSYAPSQHVGGLAAYSPVWDTNNDSRAQVECMLKLRDSKIDIGTALGESRETLAFIAKNFSRALSAYRAARRGNFRETARQLGVKFRRSKGSPFDQWMEYNYAWVPLMGDITGATEQLQRGFREKGQFVTARRSVSDEVGPPDEWTSGSSLRKQRCVIIARVSSTKLAAISQIGLINPLAVAWELVPFSFVVDWAIPIGNVLNAATANLGYEFVTGARSCKVESHFVRQGTYQGIQFASGTPSGSRATGSTRIRSYERVAMAGFPLPMPYYKNPFSMSHVTSALAILRSLTR